MAMCGIIELSVCPIGADNFDIFSDATGIDTNPFETGISRATILSPGFTSYSIPDGTSIVRIQSNSVCTNYIDIPITGVPTPTPTQTPTPTPTPQLLGYRINPSSFGTEHLACASSTTYADIYLQIGYSEPTLGAYFYTDPGGTAPWAADPNYWQMVSYGGNKWAVKLGSGGYLEPPAGIIVGVEPCAILPTPTPTRTPTRTPSPTPTSSPGGGPTPLPSSGGSTKITVYNYGGEGYRIDDIKVNGLSVSGGVFPILPGNSTLCTSYVIDSNATVTMYLNGFALGGEFMTVYNTLSYGCEEVTGGDEPVSNINITGIPTSVYYDGTCITPP